METLSFHPTIPDVYSPVTNISKVHKTAEKKSVILLKKIIMLCIVNQKFPPQEPLLWKLSGE